MFMKPDIKILQPKKLLGKCMRMNFVENNTALIWKSFMPIRNQITNKLGNDLFSVTVYDALPDFENFNPQTFFTKWAAVEVANFNNVPDDMQTLTLTSGMYAVFNYKGLSTDTQIFEYIIATWLPNSEYELDNRPHFEILGEQYKNNDPNSEEEIFIPIKMKQSV